MSEVSKNVSVTTIEAQQAENIFQLSAQFNATKQLADELVTANIGLRSQSMIFQHHLNAAKQLNEKLEAEKTALTNEIETLKAQIKGFENVTLDHNVEDEAAA